MPKRPHRLQRVVSGGSGGGSHSILSREISEESSPRQGDYEAAEGERSDKEVIFKDLNESEF